MLTKRIPLLGCLVLLAAPAAAQTSAEKLGYPAGKRVLILHADDVGMCFEANQAAKDYLEKGQIQSAAVMMTCPWADEFAAWYKENPRHDVGLHLTLTSEWRYYRWGPLLPRSEVRGLVDPDGYLWRRVRQVVENATADEVEKEIRAQIDRAHERGIRPSHLDTHMGTLYAHSEFVRVYLDVAEEYGIPAMVIEPTPQVIAAYREQGYPFDDDVIRMVKEYSLPKLDYFYSVRSGATYEEVRAGLMERVRGLQPGITEIIFHPSVPSEALKRITNSARQRAWEARLFADPEVRAFFEKEGVLFTNWKEMMARHTKRRAAASSGGGGSADR